MNTDQFRRTDQVSAMYRRRQLSRREYLAAVKIQEIAEKLSRKGLAAFNLSAERVDTSHMYRTPHTVIGGEHQLRRIALLVGTDFSRVVDDVLFNRHAVKDAAYNHGWVGERQVDAARILFHRALIIAADEFGIPHDSSDQIAA